MFNYYEEYLNFLKSNKNPQKSVFDKKLISTKFEILGLKLPNLRSLAKTLVKDGDENLILSNTNFCFYEQILVYGFTLSQIKINELERVEKIKSYISCFDNWSVVDSFCASLKSVCKHKELYLNLIKSCLKNQNDFVVRFGIVLLMDYFLDEKDLNNILMLAKSAQKSSYYVEMALAWLYSVSVAKNFEKTAEFLKNNKENLSLFVKQKTISKCNDSFRVEKSQKQMIKQILS